MQFLQASKGQIPEMKKMDVLTDGQFLYGIRVYYHGTNWVT